MSLYILDTDMLSLLERRHTAVVAAVAAHRFAHEVITTAITVEEIVSGWLAQLRRAKNRAAEAIASASLADAAMLLGSYRVLPMTESALAEFDRLVTLKLNVGRMNLRIAAIALTAGATVITHNLRDFQRVPALAVEDWTLPSATTPRNQP